MKLVSLRLEDSLLKKLALIAKWENLDRTNTIKKLLRDASEKALRDEALKKYLSGELTLEKASEYANCTVWDLNQDIIRLGFSKTGTSYELRWEIKKRLKELKVSDDVRERIKE